MPTKLVKSFKHEYCEVENLVYALLNAREEFDEANPRHQSIKAAMEKSRFATTSDAAEEHLKAQGIDYRTWTPPQPLKAGKYDAEVLPGGAIKVECQTITREQILELKKASDEAVEAVEPGWPRWWRYQGGIACANSEDDWGTFYDVESHYAARVTKCGLKMAAHAKHYEFTPIPATEAARILGKEQNEEWPRYATDHNSVYSFKSYSVGRRFSIADGKWTICNWRISECEDFVGFKFITLEQAKELIGEQALNESGE